MPKAELVFYSNISNKALRVTNGGFIDARAEPIDKQDGQGKFSVLYLIALKPP